MQNINKDTEIIIKFNGNTVTLYAPICNMSMDVLGDNGFFDGKFSITGYCTRIEHEKHQ